MMIVCMTKMKDENCHDKLASMARKVSVTIYNIKKIHIYNRWSYIVIAILNILKSLHHKISKKDWKDAVGC